MRAELSPGEVVAGLPPRDAWFFAKARAGHVLEPDDRLISTSNRPLARLMAETSVEGREQVWDEHLSNLPEPIATAWVEAVIAFNPADPPPEDNTWGQPLSFKLPPVEPFPLDIYPAPVAQLVRYGARSIGCPPDFLAMAVLPVAGAAIGRSVSLLLKDRYFASASVYAACVGLPGDGKSPAVSVVASPMRQIDADNFARWQDDKVAFEAGKEAYEVAAKSAKWARKYAEPNEEGSEPEPPELPPKPSPPVMERCLVGDITVEAMDAIMEQNPRGLLQVLDEASSLMTSMNQYRGGKGSDRQWYMSTWSGEPRTVDRKGNADNVPIRVPHPFLGIVGGIVPDMVGSFCDERGRHDGFIDRFLFAYPDPVPKTGWREEGIPDEAMTAWSAIVGRLRAAAMAMDSATGSQRVPRVVSMSPEGKAAWKELIDGHHAEQRDAGFMASLSGPWAKLEQYAGRLLLVLHLLELAADGPSDVSSIPEVPAGTVRNVARLLGYLKSQTRRVHEAMKARARGEEGSEDVQCILKWIFRRQSESFSRRDLTRDLAATFARRAKALEEALGWLILRDCIRLPKQPERPSGTRGRTRSPVYLVNPHLFPSQNGQNRTLDSAPASGPEDPGDSGNFADEPEDSVGEEASDDLPF